MFGDVDAAQEWLFSLAAEGRYAQDVFTTYVGPYASGARALDASDIALHNDDTHGWWLVIEGRVYDVTAFLHLHRGGDKIVRAYCGSDATAAYQAVLHHVQPEVDALRGMYQVGVVRRLNFGTRWAVMLDDNGLRYISLGDFFRAWVRYLYLVVQIKNALRSDWTVLAQALTADEPPDAMTPYKLDLAADIHDRFLSLFLDGTTGAELQFLWSATLGFAAPRLRYLKLAEELEHITAGADARRVRAASGWLRSQLHSPEPDQLRAVADVLQTHDRAYLHELKRIAAQTTHQFEVYEADTASAAGLYLVDGLRGVVAVVTDYYAGLAAALGQLGVSADPDDVAQAVEVRDAGEARFAGHGLRA